MKQYNELLNKNGLKVNKYTIKGNATIVDTPLGQFVLKKNKGNNIYKYLYSRNFNNFPKIIDYNDNYIMYEYIDNTTYDSNQRAADLINIISNLHRKTTYYKDIDFDEYKKIYESIKKQLDYINNYYLDIINIIESKIYMSPSEYLIARNISKIFSCIYYCYNELEHFYDIVKDKKRKRVVTLHNNLKLSHLIKNNNIYLISWDKSKIDMPIYDLVQFYNNYYLDFDFKTLFDEYEKTFPLIEEEKILLGILISIPEKVEFNNSEYIIVKTVRKLIDKIYLTENILKSTKEKATTAKQ